MESSNNKLAYGLMAAFYALVIFSLLTGGLVMLLAAVISALEDDLTTGMPAALLGASMVGASLLLVAPLYVNALAIFSDEESSLLQWRVDDRWLLPALAVLWAGCLAAGYYSPDLAPADWVILPIANLGAMGLPILLFARLAVRGLPILSVRRSWNMVGLGMTAGPLVILLAELMIILGLIAAFFFYVGITPGMAGVVDNWAAEVERVSEMEAYHMFMRWLFMPTTLFGVFGFLSVLVPLVEEALKPIGLWLTGNRSFTPTEGFVMGALSGAGYALFESLGANAGAAPEWVNLALGRSGASLLHIFNSAMMGWALVSAFRERKFIRLGLVYTLTIITHGIWNAIGVLFGLLSLPELRAFIPPAMKSAVPYEYVLLGIALLLLAALVAMNHQLARQHVENEYNGSPLPEGSPDTTETDINQGS